MFTNQTPYTDFHELNLDWVLKQLDIFKAELATLEDKVYNRVMAEIQPQIDTIQNTVNSLSASFDTFKAEIRQQQLDFETQINNEIADLDRRFLQLVNTVNSLIEQTKLYSDIQNENLYNRIVEDIASGKIGLGNVIVINYITGEKMTVQQMFDYLCMFHLTNPITYTQLALKNNTYTDLVSLNITYTDMIVNGNVLIPTLP